MRRTILVLIAALPLLGGCPVYCMCAGDANPILPTGEFAIDNAWQEALAEGTAVLTEDAVTFLYTDDAGNQWEIEYAVEYTYSN